MGLKIRLLVLLSLLLFWFFSQSMELTYLKQFVISEPAAQSKDVSSSHVKPPVDYIHSDSQALNQESLQKTMNPLRAQSVSRTDVELLQQYDKELQEELTEAHTLEEAITLAKSKQDSLFAEQAPERFSHQRQQFDDALYINSLSSSVRLEGLSNEQALEQLLSHFGEETGESRSDLQIFAHAQKLYQQLGVESSPAVNIFLAQKTLSGEQKKNIVSYQELQAVNDKQRQDYQSAYQELLSELDQQRNTDQANLTEKQWSDFKLQKIKGFKLDFFSDRP